MKRIDPDEKSPVAEIESLARFANVVGAVLAVSSALQPKK